MQSFSVYISCLLTVIKVSTCSYTIPLRRRESRLKKRNSAKLTIFGATVYTVLKDLVRVVFVRTFGLNGAHSGLGVRIDPEIKLIVEFEFVASDDDIATSMFAPLMLR